MVVVVVVVVLTDSQSACGPASKSHESHCRFHQLPRKQVQVLPSSITVSPSLMIFPEGVLQFCPVGDGDCDNSQNKR